MNDSTRRSTEGPVQRLRVSNVTTPNREDVTIIVATADVLDALMTAAEQARSRPDGIARASGVNDGKPVSVVFYRQID